MGKGSKQRPGDKAKYDSGYDRIFSRPASGSAVDSVSEVSGSGELSPLEEKDSTNTSGQGRSNLVRNASFSEGTPPPKKPRKGDLLDSGEGE